MESYPEEDVRRAAEEIRSWMAEHEGAAETLRGIVEWWLMRRRFEEAWRTVEQAMDLLVAEGAVRRVALPGGETLFASNRPGASQGEA